MDICYRISQQNLIDLIAFSETRSSEEGLNTIGIQFRFKNNSSHLASIKVEVYGYNISGGEIAHDTITLHDNILNAGFEACYVNEEDADTTVTSINLETDTNRPLYVRLENYNPEVEFVNFALEYLYDIRDNFETIYLSGAKMDLLSQISNNNPGIDFPKEYFSLKLEGATASIPGGGDGTAPIPAVVLGTVCPPKWYTYATSVQSKITSSQLFGSLKSTESPKVSSSRREQFEKWAKANQVKS